MYQILVRDDCTEAMKRLPDASVHSVVCDPPYHLTSIVERFGKEDAAAVKVPEGGSGVYARSSKGFMGKVWDGGDVAFRVETWREVFRVLKPGGHLLAFGGTRTYHRMACAIEDAGFEIRDSIHYTYGSGFPKSHAVSKNVPEEHTEAWKGWGTALKPSHEVIVLARRPLEGTVAKNCLKHGTGALNIDATRVATTDNLNGGAYAVNPTERTVSVLNSREGDENVFRRGGAGEFVQPEGRWPANTLIQHSPGCDEECAEGCPVSVMDEQSGGDGASRYFNVFTLEPGEYAPFFYAPKAARKEREAGLGAFKTEDKKVANDHPTVKSIALMEWCVTLVTPPEGVVLDPFMGSGSTGIASFRSGFSFIGMEADEHYMDIAEARIRHHGGEPEVIR
jgi:site-specific DNA-methyltransferase (adenine-specific)